MRLPSDQHADDRRDDEECSDPQGDLSQVFPVSASCHHEGGEQDGGEQVDRGYGYEYGHAPLLCVPPSSFEHRFADLTVGNSLPGGDLRAAR